MKVYMAKSLRNRCYFKIKQYYAEEVSHVKDATTFPLDTNLEQVKIHLFKYGFTEHEDYEIVMRDVEELHEDTFDTRNPQLNKDNPVYFVLCWWNVDEKGRRWSITSQLYDSLEESMKYYNEHKHDTNKTSFELEKIDKRTRKTLEVYIKYK